MTRPLGPEGSSAEPRSPNAMSVRDLLERMREVLLLEQHGEGDLDREIGSQDVSSPGLALAGYVERFASERIQVLGETEISYLNSLKLSDRKQRLEVLVRFPIPCLVVTKAQQLPDGLLEMTSKHGVPVLVSRLRTNEFYRRIKPVLEEQYAPTTNLHGSLADVYGVGLLFIGASGIGKSECVLDLVERGHRLVADDLVFVTRRGNDILIGRGHELQRHYMEIRGIGLVDIPAIFGIRSVRQQKRIEVVVQLEEWQHDRPIERTGLDGESTTILDVELPLARVALNPGKNITVIAEVIAMHHLLRYSGQHPAERFNERLMKHMRDASELKRYLREDDE